MPLVQPLAADANPDVKKLAEFFNETLGFCPNSVLTMQIRPEIARSFINMNMAVMDNQGSVTSALKRMTINNSVLLSASTPLAANFSLGLSLLGISDIFLTSFWHPF